MFLYPTTKPINPFLRLTRLNSLNSLIAIKAWPWNLIPTPPHLLRSSRGISIITILILLAFVVAAFNAYAYFNPKFELSRYSIVYLLHAGRDKQRVADLKKIQGALEEYYNDHGTYPATDGWCGPIYSAMNPEVEEALTTYLGSNVPRDPGFREAEQDYFYRRENSQSYVLMAVLENPPAGSPTYSYSGCHNWPGDGVYNYRLEVSR